MVGREKDMKEKERRDGTRNLEERAVL